MSSFHISSSSGGFVAVFGDGVDAIVRSYLPDAPTPSHAFHITLTTKDESRTLRDRGTPPPFSRSTPLGDIVPLGVGTSRGGIFVVVLFPSADRARKQAGLPAKDFHITISTPAGISLEDIAHDISTLTDSPLSPSSSVAPSPRVFDALALHHLVRGECYEAVAIAEAAIAQDPTSFKPFVRLGDASARLERHKSAMLAYGQAFDLSDPSVTAVLRHAVVNVVRASAGTEWGAAATKDELATLEAIEQASVREALLRPWSAELRDAVGREVDSLSYPEPTLQIWSRVPVFVPNPKRPPAMHHMPRFFRWIVPFHLAVSSEPRDELDVDVLAGPVLGIRHIVTLTSERTLPASWFRNKSISNTYLPLEDGAAPSLEQIEAVLRLASNPETTPLLVHCAGGKGRAGSMIASYLAAYGFARPEARELWKYPAMGFRQAINVLRLIRPGSIETTAQEERVRQFVAHVSKRGSVLPPAAVESTTPFPEIEGTISKDTDLIILVGLPGSGKSWFRNAVVARDPSWTFVSSDEDGGTSAVLTAASHHRRGKLIIDRVNSTVQNRRELLDLAQHAQAPLAVFFASDVATCLDRAQRRTDHPTLPPGGRVSAAIKQFEKSLVRPQLKEGFLAIATVSSFPSSLALVRRLTPPTTLFKFPRTPHLIDLGGVTDDDETRPLANFSASTSASAFAVITEKVDGGNLAFSLDANRRILVQNRSHYVDSGYHAQFKKLGAWVEAHREELDAVLGEDEWFPERFILFGEWLAAVHNVKYTRLPDLFLAFDLHDRATRQFISRKALEQRLVGTKIILAPVIYLGPLLSERDLVRMIEQLSSFSDDRMEGVYVKLENDEHVVERGKVVRGDFLAGNEHWSKGIISFNGVEDSHRLVDTR